MYFQQRNVLFKEVCVGDSSERVSTFGVLHFSGMQPGGNAKALPLGILAQFGTKLAR